MASYLVTGAAGFIGSHLAQALVERGEHVRGFDNFSTGLRSNLAALADRMELIEGDLRDPKAIGNACEGIDFVLHEGALASVPRSVSEPVPSHTTNIDGTFNLLEAARDAGVKRIVYAASSSAYGDQPGFPRVETMAPQPLSPYAVQKLACEYYLSSYWAVYKLETVSLRYFNIFGPRQDPTSQYSGVMARFILQMMRGEQPTIFGDGEQGRDFTYIDNVVQANMLALKAPADKVCGRVFNVATGQRQSLNELYKLLKRLMKFDRDARYGPTRQGDVRDSHADISAARNAMGYDPGIDFEEGMRRTIAWYQQAFAGQVGKAEVRV